MHIGTVQRQLVNITTRNLDFSAVLHLNKLRRHVIAWNTKWKAGNEILTRAKVKPEEGVDSRYWNNKARQDVCRGTTCQSSTPTIGYYLPLIKVIIHRPAEQDRRLKVDVKCPQWIIPRYRQSARRSTILLLSPIVHKATSKNPSRYFLLCNNVLKKRPVWAALEVDSGLTHSKAYSCAGFFSSSGARSQLTAMKRCAISNANLTQFICAFFRRNALWNAIAPLNRVFRWRRFYGLSGWKSINVRAAGHCGGAAGGASSIVCPLSAVMFVWSSRSYLSDIETLMITARLPSCIYSAPCWPSPDPTCAKPSEQLPPNSIRLHHSIISISMRSSFMSTKLSPPLVSISPFTSS